MSRVSVIIVGGQKAIAAALLALSRDKQIHVMACINDVAELLNALSRQTPHIVLIEFNMVSESHYPLLSELRRVHPKTKVLFLCNNANQTKLVDAFSYGASGYLDTKDNDAFLAKAVRAVRNGEVWVPRHFVTKIVERLSQISA